MVPDVIALGAKPGPPYQPEEGMQMTNSRILRVLAVALGLTLAFGTAAFASDSVVADGDLLDGTFDVTNPGDTDPNDAAQFGDVCPGGTYQQNARLTIR